MLTAGLLVGASLTGPASAEERSSVILGGVAYSFTTGKPIPHARIAVEETGAAVESDDNGRWSLDVPVGSDATVHITKLGWYPMYTQTFRNVQQDIPDVFLQTPDLATTAGLWALVAVQTGKDPFSGGCVIVSTVVDKRAVGMSFEELMGFAPHGVPGATASASPALRGPLYFNDSVLPDISLSQTSTDGGVMWTNVPTGTYTFHAAHPTEKFAPFTATCKDHRFINASPAHGLHGIP
ncbi:hypothetical protein [Streptomyces palmae]|uniref:Carboxypeptidase regulatory-like domain-containing protein n=1 Tax=Streptomyces palmae TaxID=1701085 RepID=A0A4Z0HJU2_9ACTN|nr:hypothetical protein [Streptomyces palmae]TGB19585.1 hypothetical protein E4099_00055 [Streptomyces palmae]